MSHFHHGHSGGGRYGRAVPLTGAPWCEQEAAQSNMKAYDMKACGTAHHILFTRDSSRIPAPAALQPTSELLHGLGREYIVDQAIVLVLAEARAVIGHHARAVLPAMLQHEQPLKQLRICWPLHKGYL